MKALSFHQPGERIEVWSNLKKNWMPSTVTRYDSRRGLLYFRTDYYDDEAGYVPNPENFRLTLAAAQLPLFVGGSK